MFPSVLATAGEPAAACWGATRPFCVRWGVTEQVGGGVQWSLDERLRRLKGAVPLPFKHKHLQPGVVLLNFFASGPTQLIFNLEGQSFVIM